MALQGRVHARAQRGHTFAPMNAGGATARPGREAKGAECEQRNRAGSNWDKEADGAAAGRRRKPLGRVGQAGVLI